MINYYSITRAQCQYIKVKKNVERRRKASSGRQNGKIEKNGKRVGDITG